MSDTIYRQDAIEAVNIAYTSTEAVNNRPVNDYERELYFRIQGELSKLPSAQQQRKMGKWITVPGRLGDEVECNQCNNVFWYWMGNYRYCPNCGARMESWSDEMQ